MGYNTAVVVMNDALGAIKDDPKFGENLYYAILESQRNKQVDVPAYSYRDGEVRGVHCNAATVISGAHADDPQVMVVKYNTGYVAKYKEELPDYVIEDMKWVLKQHGYRVSKEPKKKVA
jgi:hypothetical protein